MALNIKNERVHELARAAARRTGTNQTSAIETALERYLEQLDSGERRRGDDLTGRIDWILTDMRERLQVAALDTNDLYDDAGLPA